MRHLVSWDYLCRQVEHARLHARRETLEAAVFGAEDVGDCAGMRCSSTDEFRWMVERVEQSVSCACTGAKETC